MKKVFFMLLIFFGLGVFVYAEDSNLVNSDRESEVIDNNNSNTNSNDNVNTNTNSNNSSDDLDTNVDSDTTNGSDNDKSTSDSNSGNGVNLASNAKSAIMIEASTGKVIFEKNANEGLPMASMTKMMTLLIIMENIDNGNLKWDEKVTASEYAASMGGSQIFLEVGEEMTVEDLVKGICIGSGNDAVVTKKQSLVISEEIII